MGKFIIKKTETGIKFDLKAGNGEIIATSQVYKAKAYCKTGIASVMKNSITSHLEDQTAEDYEVLKNPKYEIYKDNAGEYRFRLKALNGQIIAISQGYKEKDGCKKGIESVRKNARDARIEETD